MRGTGARPCDGRIYTARTSVVYHSENELERAAAKDALSSIEKGVTKGLECTEKRCARKGTKRKRGNDKARISYQQAFSTVTNGDCRRLRGTRDVKRAEVSTMRLVPRATRG